MSDEQVRMVTGDNIQTAKAIAAECGILPPDSDATEPVVIEGKAFRALSEQEREEVAKKITVCLNGLKVLSLSKSLFILS